MSLGTTIVAGSVSVVFPCMPIVLVVVVSAGSILIGVCTLILVLSVVCILAVCLECGESGQLVTMVSNDGPWFAISMSLALICFSVSGMVFSKVMVFLLPWQFWRLVTSVGVMKEFVFPSCPVLTTRRFVVGPGQLSGQAIW